jgi:hypothetical protein
MTIYSILEQVFVEHLLATARLNLERDNKLQPFLWVTAAPDIQLVVPLDLGKTAAEKQAYFRQIARDFRRRDEPILEAVMVAEGWFVNARTAPDATRIPPSQHPLRQEAITIVGRNASNTHQSWAVQPFRRDAHNKPVWEKMELAVFNEAKPLKAVGLLDNLFL